MAERDTTQVTASLQDAISRLEETVKDLTMTLSEQKSIIGELCTKVASCEDRIRQLETTKQRVRTGIEEESTVFSPSFAVLEKGSMDTERERKRQFENPAKNHHTETAISPTNGEISKIATGTVFALSSETKRRRRGGGLENNKTFARKPKALSRASTAPHRRTFGSDISNTSSIPHPSSRRRSVVGTVHRSNDSSKDSSSLRRLAAVNSNSAVKRKRERKRQLEDLSLLLRSTTSSEDALTAITPTNNNDDEKDPHPFAKVQSNENQDQFAQSHMSSTVNHTSAEKESIEFRNETNVRK